MVSVAGHCAFKWEWRFLRQLFVGSTRAQATSDASNIGHTISEPKLSSAPASVYLLWSVVGLIQHQSVTVVCNVVLTYVTGLN